MIFVLAVTVAIFIGLLTVLRKLARTFVSSNSRPESIAWIEELSIERYRPMLRLLDEEDFHFLQTQPGFTSQMAAKVRLQRCKIFRAYLRNLDADFVRICVALKAILAHSKTDRPDLASALVQRQMVFAYRKMTIQFQVVLFRYGLGTVDVSYLVRLFDGVRLELQTLVPAMSPVRA